MPHGEIVCTMGGIDGVFVEVDSRACADRRKKSAHQPEKWDGDARAMSKSFRIEDCRVAM